MSELSQVPLGLPKGRPPSKGKKKMLSQVETALENGLSKSEAEYYAQKYAEEAATKHVHSRRGVWAIAPWSDDDPGFLVYYNNNPYNGNAELRIKETKRIIRRLKKVGISVLARGEAGGPVANSKEQYTFSLVLDCGVERQSEVAGIIGEEVRDTFEKK
ncbi:MAG: hypothetical protein ABL921_07475 [Pirellula sp.]